MFRKLLIAGAFATLTFTAVSAAQATDIKSLFNTGTKTYNTGDQGEGLADLHYTVGTGSSKAKALAALQNPTYTVITSGFPIPQFYLGNNVADVNSVGKSSKWISTTAAAANSPSPAYYAFRTTFDLTNFDPNSATIRGKWLTDNDGIDILLNGASLGDTRQAGNSPHTDYKTFDAFTDISAGFVPGINTLDFVVYNRFQKDGNPASLRVELIGTATTIPEPVFVQMSALLMGGGLLAFRKRARKTNV